MNRLLSFLALPPQISVFERRYLEKVNRIAALFFAMHIPVFALIGWFNRTGAGTAVTLTVATLVGPFVALALIKNPRTVSMVMGITAMFFGGLLVHFGQGPVQIEMHFYFFSLLAMTAVFGNPLVILAAASTVALHHLIVWAVLPSSVFNYNASWWVVGVHFIFVILESVAACFIARSFFDNVIGLEKIVQARTAQLDARNGDMRLLLDNVSQGFLTVDAEGRLAAERSAAIDRWFGAPAAGHDWFDFLATVSPDFAARTRCAWAAVVEGVMPLELTLEQMPHRAEHGGRTFHVEYLPIGAGSDGFSQCLVVVTDITTQIEGERAARELEEALAIFERVLSDRAGLETFCEEADAIVRELSLGTTKDLSTVSRLLHTLKGNCALYKLGSLATLCHVLEDTIADTGASPEPHTFDALAERWAHVAGEIGRLLGHKGAGFELEPAQHEALVRAIHADEQKDALLARVQALAFEPTARRLEYFADQARRIATRLEKGRLDVRIEDEGVRLDPKRFGRFWGVFVHAVRNAVDHGIEPESTRVARGKPASGLLVLRTAVADGMVTIDVEDDGGGVDWTAIATKALSRGQTCETPDDLRRAIFAGGLSTAATVTELSGRGIGMGALLEGAEALGGTLTLHSESGKGTRIRAVLPLNAAPDTSPARIRPAA